MNGRHHQESQNDRALIGFRVRRTLNKRITADHDGARADSQRLHEKIVKFTEAIVDITIDWLTTADLGEPHTAEVFQMLGIDPDSWFRIRSAYDAATIRALEEKGKLARARTERAKYSWLLVEPGEKDAVRDADRAINCAVRDLRIADREVDEHTQRANEEAARVIRSILARLEVIKLPAGPLSSRIAAVAALRSEEIASIYSSLRQRELLFADSLERAANILRSGGL